MTSYSATVAMMKYGVERATTTSMAMLESTESMANSVTIRSPVVPKAISYTAMKTTTIFKVMLVTMSSLATLETMCSKAMAVRTKSLETTVTTRC